MWERKRGCLRHSPLLTLNILLSCVWLLLGVFEGQRVKKRGVVWEPKLGFYR